MRVLIYEPDYGGHFLHYVRHLVLAMAELPVETTVALCQNAPGTSEYEAHLADLGGAATWDTSSASLPFDRKKRYTASVRLLRQAIERHRPDRVYVPYADGLGQVLGLRRVLLQPTIPRHVATEGLSLRGSFCYPQADWKQAIRANLYWAAAKRARWDIFHLLDPVVFEHVRRHDPKLARRCRLMPDPVEQTSPIDRQAARRELGIPEDGRYIGVVGLIDTRKGCDHLIRAFARAPLADTDRLLLAGRQDVEIRDLLAEAPYAKLVSAGRIQCINRIIPTPQMAVAIAATDLVATFYPRHVGSASIAIRAAAGERPVLASNYGWLGLIAPRFDLGWTTNVLDHPNLPRAIADALDRAGGYAPSQQSRQFVAYHSLPNFKAHWTRGVRAALGLPDSPDLLDWDELGFSLS